MKTQRIGVTHHLLSFVALVALATVSLVVGTMARWAYWDVVLSLAVAVVKVGVVLWFFMHVAEQPFRVRLAILVTFLLIFLLIALTAADVGTRQTQEQRGYPPPGGFYRH